MKTRSSALQKLIDYGASHGLMDKEYAAELALLREALRLLRLCRENVPGNMFVVYDEGGRPYRELVDELLAKIDNGKVATK